ncbi:MAG: RNA-directed DNA polymerase [Planctomycetota bacterium]|nr:MAG: RNA-directed DNA polymerase [Planctomycetota bacterium]
MANTPQSHRQLTEDLARKLKRPDIFAWLGTTGFFPEPYVLPPNFCVSRHKPYKKKPYWNYKRSGPPKTSDIIQVHFPKTELTDRTFGIIDPELHCDIAYHLCRNWSAVLDCLFHRDNKVCSYSFPIPVDSKTPGKIGGLRSGRMIYEFIEMAENDLASLAYQYEVLVKTDIKNFYPSVYTHSIPWALHGKRTFRGKNKKNRYNTKKYFGNRLDKLFQYANDECTNGIPIGPVVSDLAAEIVLSAVDRHASSHLPKGVIVVRFKDDYRILAKNTSDARNAVKAIQEALAEYNLELNDKKTASFTLPDGLFRQWVSMYHECNPRPKQYYQFKRFREVYLSVVNIDRSFEGCGVIDRFLADLCTKKNRIRAKLDRKTLPKVMSMLLLLARRRTKSFPKVLAIIESILRSPFGKQRKSEIAQHLDDYLVELAQNERQNRYLLIWVVYFMKSNNLEGYFSKRHQFKDPILRATYTSREPSALKHPDFKTTRGVKQAAKALCLLEHLAVFNPQ